MPRRSILLAVTASLFFAGSTFLSKLLGSGFLDDALHPLQIAHSRFAFGLLTAMMFCLAARRHIVRPHWRLHLLRSTLGWLGIAVLFTGVIHIPASDAVAITFLNPIFAMMFAILLLDERVGKHRWSAAIIAFVGGVLLIRPEATGTNPIALLCLGGAAIIGLEIVVIKMLASREDVFQILLINNAIAAVVATVPLFFIFDMPSASQWAALAAVGGVMVTGQMLFLFAMRSSDASLVAPFIYATLIFVMLFDFGVLGVVPDFVSLAGTGIIIAGGSYIAIREQRQTTS
ncbi:MAG: DMT family transporter [Candidatus Puniceispirillaceae bacterium]|jgi:drug/metabolite transporter (DMT)-like permease